MKHLIALSALLISGPAFAAETVQCQGSLNSGTHAAFELPATGNATLAFDYREFVIDMSCTTFAADIPVTECVEIIPGGNKYIVQFAAGQAHVAQESNVPSVNVVKGTLNCK
ncbi:hypothetical protein ACLVWU_11605 [Bdellovibrio sp. HCB290]|uniref:hypothetical protein n=1 Tax=Bdellovibrio sp. HCB290 TaxID=3394356 RepID=UPI0039B39784